MSITYTWKIKSVKTKKDGDNVDAVVQTYWQKIGTDLHGNTGTFEGATPFSAATVSNSDFIPFGQLSEEIVLGWIKSVVIGEYEKHVNEKIQEQIDHATNPIAEPDLPWVLKE